ncbi:MAG TPA: hypothetical protein VKB59_13595 [Micromonosporaceae bacterium]|nr:hypothetical protein [Micromonosporaceae bacterium]
MATFTRLLMAVGATLTVSAAGCTADRMVPPSPARSTAAIAPGAPGAVRTCDNSGGHYDYPPSQDDVSVGALTYLGAKKMASSTPNEYFGGGPPSVDPNGVFFKVGTVLAPNATVTVAIAPSARSWAALEDSSAANDRQSAIRYEACKNARTVWHGGFVIRNDHERACLPLDVYIGKSGVARHLTLSLFNGAC